MVSKPRRRKRERLDDAVPNGNGTDDRDPSSGKFNRGNRAAKGRKTQAARVRAWRRKVATGEVEKVLDRLRAEAEDGDVAAARVWLSYALGTPAPMPPDPIEISLPRIERAADCVRASAAILEAVSSGKLAPERATRLADLVEVAGRLIELSEIEQRLDALEERFGGDDGYEA